MDVTEDLLQTEKTVVPSFNSLVGRSLVGVAILHGRDMEITFANQRMIDIWGKGKAVIGRKLIDEFPEIQDQGFSEIFQQVLRTGKPYYGYETKALFNKTGKSNHGYFNFICQPYEESDVITGLTLFTTEVSEAVAYKKQIEESEKQFRNVLLESPSIFAIIQGFPEMVLTFGNEPLFRSWGKGPEIVGKPLLEILPELADQPFPKLLQKVFETGETHYGDETKAFVVKDGKRAVVYYKFVYQPILGTDRKVSGITIMANDITSQVLSRRAVEEHNRVLEMVTSGAPLAEALTFLLQSIERQSNHEMIGSILLLDDEGKRLRNGVAPSLPAEYINAIDDLEIGPNGESHDTAGFRVSEVVVSDIATHSLWNDLKHLALPLGLRACWSIPIVSHNLLLGTFALYFRQVHEPTPTDREIMGFALRTAKLIIERKRSEEALRKSKEESDKRKRLYEAVTGATPDLIYVFNLNYRITYANDALLKMWGRSWEDSIGRELRDLGYEDWHAEMHEREIDQVVATKQSIRGEVCFPHAVSGKRIYDYIFVPVLNNYGVVEAVAGTTRDITDIKQAEENLRDLAAQLERKVEERTQALKKSNDDLQQFAHVASHDLKEPVRKIKTFAYRLQDELKNSSQAAITYTEKILNSTDRMYNMIEGVLTYSSANGAKQEISVLDLNAILAEVQTDLEIVIQEKQASINNEPLPHIEGVHVLIQQLFYNLINNALKFSKPGVPPVIHVTSRTIQLNGIDSVEIKIKDNGIGFESIYNEKVFHAFARLNPKQVFDGTGLGLSLCSKIVDRHHGSIDASGEFNVGATFTLVLPVKQKS